MDINQNAPDSVNYETIQMLSIPNSIVDFI